MAKKKTTKKTAPKADVNKSQEIKKALAATPDKPPKEIAEELTAKGVKVSAGFVSTVKTNLKTKAAKTKKRAKKKVVAKKAVAKKTAGKKPAPKASSSAGITFDQLCMAKELAQQLGGVEKAKAALGALSQLTD